MTSSNLVGLRFGAFNPLRTTRAIFIWAFHLNNNSMLQEREKKETTIETFIISGTGKQILTISNLFNVRQKQVMS